ncbi:MAG: hypothetical protein Q8834_02505, partial [Candidatus Phytoplasma australasiaticum]|nr:hypothetical protein [Candidatus Phytoplasma australasiaticum]
MSYHYYAIHCLCLYISIVLPISCYIASYILSTFKRTNADFNIKTDYIILQNRTSLHKLIILEFKQIIKQIIESYESYNFE